MSGAGIVQRPKVRGSWGRHPPTPSRAPAAGLGVRLKAQFLTLVLIVVTLGVGWLVWSVVEWRNGRTVSYRLTGLRVVRHTDRRPIGLGLSLLRNGLCCSLLIVPTVLGCLLLGLSFVLGASPPGGLLDEPRLAPWDVLAGTEVVDERAARSGRASLVPLPLPEGATVSMN
jgi:uncharacterized RDD family membrane protein YckC